MQCTWSNALISCCGWSTLLKGLIYTRCILSDMRIASMDRYSVVQWNWFLLSIIFYYKITHYILCICILWYGSYVRCGVDSTLVTRVYCILYCIRVNCTNTIRCSRPGSKQIWRYVLFTIIMLFICVSSCFIVIIVVWFTLCILLHQYVWLSDSGVFCIHHGIFNSCYIAWWKYVTTYMC